MAREGYKLTEIGEIPEEWEVVSVLKGLGKKKFKVGKIKQLDYKEIGKIPVVDQGNNYIAGYSDDEEKAYKSDLPVIIFGDHTRIIKYIDFSFIIGADGVKVLLPDRDIFYPKFFYYALLNLQVESRGYNRHFSILKEKILPLPPLPEQKKIAEILSTVDEDIRKTDEIIAKTQELKKGMMQQLLTRGIGHTRFKKTEIGEIPEDWEVVRLEQLMEEPLKNGINYTKSDFGFGTKFVNVLDIFCESVIDNKKLNRINISQKAINNYKLKTGDILIVRSSLKREGVGYPALFQEDNEPVVFCGFIIRIRPNKNILHPFYLLDYLRSPQARERLVSKSGTVAITNVNQTNLKNLKVPLPKEIEEQQKIAEILSTIDEKIEIERKRKEKLEELKKGLMQDLLTGKVRVKI